MKVVLSNEHRAKVEEFRRKQRTGILVLLFTDLVGSTRLKQDLGDQQAVAITKQHHAMVRELLARFADSREIDTAGDGFFIVFVKPSDAVKFALLLQAAVRKLAAEINQPIADRIGIHAGEVFMEDREGSRKPLDLFGIQVDSSARVMSLAESNQILMTRFVFDNARQLLHGEELEGIGALSWLGHGPYQLKGVEEPLEICEVGETGLAPLGAPPDSEKAHRHAMANADQVLGWRPAVQQQVPNTHWLLETKLGEGGFGEVWLARHKTLKDKCVFKFCFRADRVRSLKREVTLFKLLRDRVGEHPGIVAVRDVFFDEPPFYIIMDYAEGLDLCKWIAAQGGIEKVPLTARLEIVAQLAEALQAAHDAGVIHRDIKPSNIIVSIPHSGGLRVELTDFGIGQLVSPGLLDGMTQMGFTQATMAGSSDTGTPLYMAPELMAGKPASTRSDIYSLGVVLFQLLAGDLTLPATMDWARGIENGLLREDLARCLAGDPQERFAGAQELAQRIRKLPERQQELARREAEIAAREKAARRSGMFRAAMFAAVVILLLAGLAVDAFYESRQAKSETKRAENETKLVQKAVIQARETLSGAYLSKAAGLLAEGKRNDALAYLAGSLAANPTNAAAVTWLATLLCSHDWWIPMEVSKHDGAVVSAEFSPDGKRVVTASQDKTARIWDAQTGQPLTGPLHHDGPVSSAEFSPDGMKIVTASGDYTARVWDAQSGQPLTPPLKHTQLVSYAGFSPDGKRIVTASWDGTAQIWDAQSGQSLTRPLNHSAIINSAEFSPDGGRIVTASGDGTARVWDAQTGQPITAPLKHDGWVSFAQFSPDGTRIVTASRDKTARVWDAQTGQPITSPLKHDGQVAFAQFSPDGKRIVTASGDGTARIWDAQTGQPLTQPLKHEGPVLSARFSPDGKCIVTASADGTARIWDAQTGQPLTEPLKHGNAINAAMFSPDGKRIVTASADGTVRVWNAQNGPVLAEPLVHERPVSAARFSPDGTRVVTASSDGTARLWDAASGRPINEPLRHSVAVTFAQFSADGKEIVTISADKTARVWDAQTGQPITEPLKHDGFVSSAQFSPDGKCVVTASWDGIARVWDTQSGKLLLESLKHNGIIFSAQFSPDGKKIVTASVDKTARVWDAQTGLPLTEPMPHGDQVLFAQFSPDGTRVITACVDGTARVWDAQTGKALTDALKHDGQISSAQFSPDGKWIVTASADKTARVWDAQSGRPLTEPLKHNGRVSSAQFSPDGQRVVTASDDQIARVWDAQSGQPLPEVFKHDAPVWWAQFSPDGKRVITVSGDAARIWDLIPTQPAYPAWLLTLSKALSGQVLNDSGFLEPVTENRAQNINQIRDQLSQEPTNDDWVIWGRWLLADPATRTISPFSTLTVPDYKREF